MREPEKPKAERTCTIIGMPYLWPAAPLIISATPMTVQPMAMARNTCIRLSVPTSPEPMVKVPIDTQPPSQANR